MRLALPLAAILLSACAATLSACAATGETPADQRATIDRRTEEVLDRLFQESPSAQAQVERAAGYAVFSNFGIDFFLVGGGGGYGVAIQLPAGERTYMRMGEAGVGIGLGARDFRAVFVFENNDRLQQFLEGGWDASVEASAAAEADGSGASATGAASFNDGVAIYQLTETGLALRANLRGTKFWKDASLN